MRTPYRRGAVDRRLVAVGVLVLASLVPALSVAVPADAAPAPLAAAPERAAPDGGPVTPHATYRTLNITMQAQQQSNWCWAASGNTVASYYGYSYSQNQFCNLAFDRSMNSDCPNSQATLGNDQEAFGQIGISPGSYVDGYLSGTTVITEIDHDRPILTRIQWQSGGGHMMVLYGYDTSQDWLYWGDPWPSDNRYNYGDYDWYISNSSFFWTHSLYRIGA